MGSCRWVVSDKSCHPSKLSGVRDHDNVTRQAIVAPVAPVSRQVMARRTGIVRCQLPGRGSEVCSTFEALLQARPWIRFDDMRVLRCLPHQVFEESFGGRSPQKWWTQSPTRARGGVRRGRGSPHRLHALKLHKKIRHRNHKETD